MGKLSHVLTPVLVALAAIAAQAAEPALAKVVTAETAAPVELAGAAEAAAEPPVATDDAPAPEEEKAQPAEGDAEPEKTGIRYWLPSLKVNGAFSYGYDFNDPVLHITNAQEGVYSGMDRANAFNADLLQLGLSGSFPHFGYEIKADSGDLARIVGDEGTANRSIVYFHGGGQWEIVLQEAFVYGEAGPVTIALGRVPSPIGYEVVEPWDNVHITHSRAWLEQPISFDGVTLAVSHWGIDALAGYVNSFMRNNEYDSFGGTYKDGNLERDFDETIRHSSGASGLIYKAGTKIFDTDISAAGFWGKMDQARYLNRRAQSSVPLLTVAEEPSDQILFNLVVSRAIGPINAAAEFNYGHTDGVNLWRARLVGDDPLHPDVGRFLTSVCDTSEVVIDPIDGSRTPTTCSSSSVNGTLYLGLPFANHGSFDLRGDFGRYISKIRNKESDQWSITSTLSWQFNDYIGVRAEYRYDSSNEKANPDLATFDDDGDPFSTRDSVHAVWLQVLLAAGI